MQLLHRGSASSIRGPGRQKSASSLNTQRACTAPRPSVCVSAKRRQLDRDYPFPEVYAGVIEKLRERNHLSIRDMSQLIECIKSVEQAGRCLDILSAYVASKSAGFAQDAELDEPLASTSSSVSADMNPWLADWPTRKRFLARIAEIAVLELNRPELAFAIVGNTERFKLSTYFGKDLINQLGSNGSVSLEVLKQIAQIVQQQRGPSDKGSKGAWHAVLAASQDRGSSAETMASIKQQLSPPAPTPMEQPARPVPALSAVA